MSLGVIHTQGFINELKMRPTMVPILYRRKTEYSEHLLNPEVIPV